ncbi:hypothetical protein DRJ25_06280 [Candidatus Woesearchaeota archaeon]|nr:MAG: hypothetical protein DRJ25_06280 [Candidatus Woesearchaeota archaeon]
MKKSVIVFAVSTVLSVFCFAGNSLAQQDVAPPLLVQQNPASAMPPAAPGVPPLPPAAPPLPGPGVAVVQTIPAQTLLSHLPKAAATVQKLNKQLAPGKVWVMRAPAGEMEIKAGLLYQGVVVAVLHFNPLDGSVLPLGINPRTYQCTVQLQAIKARISAAIGNLKILPAAEFMGPEACWLFPVALGDTIVAHVKVYYDGIHIVQDYAGNQEMMFYGQ